MVVFRWGIALQLTKRRFGIVLSSDLFQELQSWHPKLDGIQFDMLEDGEAIEIENLFTKEKEFQALYSVDSDKAPGLDDFTIDFFQKCWNVVKGDIVWLFHNFHHREMFERSLNPAFISLIPKKKSRGCGVQKDFRPISLIGSVYKILAKVLGNRVKKVLDKLISNTQMLLWAANKF